MRYISSSLGWIGTFLILGAYALVSFSVLNSNSVTYQLMNLLGALGVVVDTYSKEDTPPEVLNIVWTIIALVSLIRILLFR